MHSEFSKLISIAELIILSLENGTCPSLKCNSFASASLLEIKGTTVFTKELTGKQDDRVDAGTLQVE